VAGAVAIAERVEGLRQAGLLAVEHGAPAARAIGAALLRMADLTTDAGTFEAEAGLCPGWQAEARRARRDAMLIDLRRRHFADLTARAAAAAIETAGRRYAAAGFRADRRAQRRPDGVRGDIFDILSVYEIQGRDALSRLFNGICAVSDPPPDTARRAAVSL
jgi:hypothetical protein